MNRITILVGLCIFLAHIGRAQLSFTINNVSNSTTLTCAMDSIHLSAVTNATGTVNYSWATTSTVLTGQGVYITKPGNYTITATSGTMTATQMLSITVNTIVPVSSTTFTFVATSTSGNFTAAAISPTANVTHLIYSPQGSVFTANSQTVIYVPGSPGTYTHCIIDNVNGCSTCGGTPVGGMWGPGSPATTTSSVHEYNNLPELTIWPNPGTGIFNLGGNNESLRRLEVYNNEGKLVFISRDPDKNLIDLSQQPSGLFLLRATDFRGTVSTARILKE